ncbi:MAG: restriction endonuclease subunit S [Patescibacteria group bacterium]
MKQIKTIKLTGWDYKQIGQLFSRNISGEWGSDPDGTNNTLVVGTPDFNNDGSIDWTSVKERKISPIRLNVRRILQGNTLIEKSGGSDAQPAGRVVFCDKTVNGTCSNFVQLLTVDKNYNPKFINYLLFFYYQKGLVYQYQQKTTGIINFKINDYFKETVQLPISITEQQKIAEILSDIDLAIEETNKLVGKYKSIKQGLMQDLFRYGIDEKGQIRSEKTHKFKDSPLGRIPEEWVIASFIDVSKVRQGLQIAISDRKHEPGINRYQYITIQYLNDRNSFNDYVQNPPKSVVSTKNDVLLTRTGNMGKVVTNEGGVFHNNFFMVDFDRNKLSKEWLVYYLTRVKIQNYFSIYAGVTTIPDLKHGDFYRTPCVYPKSIDEQTAITNILSSSDSAIEKEEVYKQKLLSLKQGLMDDLLSGKVRVNKLLN